MFGFKVKVLSVVVATIATLAQVDVGPEVFVSHESGLLNNKPEDVFKFLGESVYVPKVVCRLLRPLMCGIGPRVTSVALMREIMNCRCKWIMYAFI